MLCESVWSVWCVRARYEWTCVCGCGCGLHKPRCLPPRRTLHSISHKQKHTDNRVRLLQGEGRGEQGVQLTASRQTVLANSVPRRNPKIIITISSGSQAKLESPPASAAEAAPAALDEEAGPAPAPVTPPRLPAPPWAEDADAAGSDDAMCCSRVIELVMARDALSLTGTIAFRRLGMADVSDGFSLTFLRKRALLFHSYVWFSDGS
jgi:hypothetical protein